MSDDPHFAAGRPRRARRSELARLTTNFVGQPFLGERARRVLRVDSDEAGESTVPVQMHFVEAVPHLQSTDVGATRPDYFGRGLAHHCSLFPDQVHEQLHSAGGGAASVPPQSVSNSDSNVENSGLDQSKSLAGSRLQEMYGR